MPTSKNTARKYAAGGSSDNSCGVEPLRAVIYARYSSSGQREESIEGQLRDCYEFAKKHGIIVIGEYIDKAMTGRVDRRIALPVRTTSRGGVAQVRSPD